MFRKRRSAVLAWFGAGAPIVFDGTYSCDYFELQKWRVKFFAFDRHEKIVPFEDETDEQDVSTGMATRGSAPETDLGKPGSRKKAGAAGSVTRNPSCHGLGRA